MMEFESIVDVQLKAMLEGIEQDLAQRREAILEDARHQARARLRDARRQARQRMAAAIAEEKDQWYSSLGRASAALASRLRRKQQELDREQLSSGEEQLRTALLERWEDAAARQQWAGALVEQAQLLLPAGDWRVEYPATLSTDEAQQLFDGATASLEPDEKLEAGFRLRCGDACLDMGSDGLLAQSQEIAGELLAEIRSRQQDPEDAK